ncbi:hypothetical protein Syun_030305 [Stephania yunnanensis]|uniref:Separase-like TPR repeats region domain-containing protein n=1 Tax=Stephania yunnanensis TaxID=152371 RepID=A0AAP0E7B5_9MAGN
MASATETREKSATLDFMRLFADLRKAAAAAKKKMAKSNASDQKSIRPLAKQYLQFISRALKILPNRLSDLPHFGGGDDAEAIGSKMFDVYWLCLDCKPTSVPLQG